MLKLFNTLSHKKETFIPINSNKISMYVCGPTVYNDIHIGNARSIVVFDVLFRLLKKLYPEVVYVRNITDVDDKIIVKAEELHKPINYVSNLYTTSFHEDIKHLNVLTPSFEPKATDYIQQMITMIDDLLKKSYAYISNNHVFFAVDKFPDYGKLSGMNQEDLQIGARVEVSEFKKNPTDFVLWKPAMPNETGWDSPWGFGRPGWHIECSAIAKQYLGENFDIHGGGQDLIFPHHENERAQSICSSANKTNMANYWLHNGYLLLDAQKMSKSLNNFITLKDLLKKYNGITIRLALLSTHYRQPLNFQETSLQQANAIVTKWQTLFANNISKPSKPSQEFLASLQDDLNTPAALTVLHSNITKLQKLIKDSLSTESLSATILAEMQILGLFPLPITRTININPEDIEKLLTRRQKAKQEQNFKLADKIRDDLNKKGIIIYDGKEGTTWQPKS
ncbi:Cysteine--tRNA ligase [Candidatus Hepatincola sp. Av]